MYNNPFIDGMVAAQRLSEDRAYGDRARASKLAREPRGLATAGLRAETARWLTRNVFRAEPCAAHAS